MPLSTASSLRATAGRVHLYPALLSQSDVPSSHDVSGHVAGASHVSPGLSGCHYYCRCIRRLQVCYVNKQCLHINLMLIYCLNILLAVLLSSFLYLLFCNDEFLYITKVT